MKAVIFENDLRGWTGNALAPIASSLELVERRMCSVMTSDIPMAADAARHLLNAGGKRIRPALIILSTEVAGGTAEYDRVIDVAAAAELVHTASLVHDDVIDETIQRRGVQTTNGIWGNKIGVLAGDLMLTKALSLLNDLNMPEITSVLTNMVARMTESQILEAACEGDLASWQESYWRIIEGKTAEFMAACCRCGAILAGAGKDTQDTLVAYGTAFGKAFQVTDDLMDITGDPVRMGKDRGTDLTQGKFTLPILLAVDKLGTNSLDACIGSGFLSPEKAQEVVAAVLECGAVDMAREIALKFSEEAVTHLTGMPASRFVDALCGLAQAVVNRGA